MEEVLIVEAVRSPIGRRKGGLSGLHPAELLGVVQKAAVERSGVDPAAIGQIVAGCVSQVGEQSFNIARTAWLAQGLPQEVRRRRPIAIRRGGGLLSSTWFSSCCFGSPRRRKAEPAEAHRAEELRAEPARCPAHLRPLTSARATRRKPSQARSPRASRRLRPSSPSRAFPGLEIRPARLRADLARARPRRGRSNTTRRIVGHDPPRVDEHLPRRHGP